MSALILVRLAALSVMSVGSSAQSFDSPLQIVEVSDNREAYIGRRVPRYSLLEITFQVENSRAENPQLPYDEDPPAGIRPEIGISVDAEFTPDRWQTVYRQPAFRYQEFEDEIRGGREWFYPTERFSWKVRFSPTRAGEWQYRLAARDASGEAVSETRTFRVVDSSSPGFIRVSRRDSRYFEFEDGSYFPGLGYNMNFDRVSWRNPILDNRQNFQIMGANGIQLIRIWLSQWSIFGAEWSPWNSQDPAQHGAAFPVHGITFEEAYPGSDVSMKVAADWNPCMFIGVWKARPALKRGRRYRVRIRFKTAEMGRPKDPTKPFGLVAKTGDWLWSDEESERCYSPDAGTAVTPRQSASTEGWEVLEGWLESGSRDYLPNFFLVMENIDGGSAYVDYVSIREDLGDGRFGSNVVSKPWMAQHQYFEQRNSYAFDRLLELAAEHGVYLRLVVLEKNDRILNRIDFDGNPTDSPPGNDYFYGNWREDTKVRWLQRAWWRYLQARWGYSPHIHSWELLNEGDPFNGRHYTLADEFGKYMHQFANWHLVSTSTWHSFPREAFWDNQAFPDIDFADVHRYVSRGRDLSVRIDDRVYPLSVAADYFDSAAATARLGELVGARSPLGAGKPVIRGETGFVTGASAPPDPDIADDREGIWLHNFIWGGINPSGLIESYWYDTAHIYQRTRDGNFEFDHRHHFGAFYRFIRDVPLNNGHYQDAEARVSNPQLRAWGQKDLVNGCAHLWIQNRSHDWWNVGLSPGGVDAVSGTVRIGGFRPQAVYQVEWWDADAGAPILRQDLTAGASGELLLAVSGVTGDLAVRVGDYRSDSTGRERVRVWRTR